MNELPTHTLSLYLLPSHGLPSLASVQGEDHPPPPPPIMALDNDNNPHNANTTVYSLIPPSSLQPPLPLLPQIDSSQMGLDVVDWLGLLSANPYNVVDHNAFSSSTSIVNQNNCTDVGDDGRNNYNGSKNSYKKVGKGKKSVPPRVAFHTRSVDDILDDGYRWRKYGQKAVKNSSHPRSYYRCTHHTCNVKKQIQGLAKDSSIIVTTYEGNHNHPCEKLMESLAPLIKQLQLLSRF